MAKVLETDKPVLVIFLSLLHFLIIIHVSPGSKTERHQSVQELPPLSLSPHLSLSLSLSLSYIYTQSLTLSHSA